MQYKYTLDQNVPLLRSIIYGLQWAAILVSLIFILGKVAGVLHFSDITNQTIYIQKLLFVSAVTLFGQIVWGHRLPIIPGPAAILLTGVIASQDHTLSTIYTSIMIGGVLYSILAALGALSCFQKFFTANVIAVVLILIAFTLAPTIRNLMTDYSNGMNPFINMVFSMVLVLAMFTAYRLLTGIWRATLIIWGIIGGSLIYFIIFPSSIIITQNPNLASSSTFLTNTPFVLTLQPAVLISFLFCYIAVSINDLGSLKSMIELLEIPEAANRIKRGSLLTGLANAVSGVLGVIGPVNYSLSPGVILSTRCASRFTLIPASIFLLILGFSPDLVGLLGYIPASVTGAVLTYIMSSQVAAGLIVAFKDSKEGGFQLENGMIIGLSVLLGTMVAFMPPDITNNIPGFLRPICGNGFIIGTLSAIFLDHLPFGRSRP